MLLTCQQVRIVERIVGSNLRPCVLISLLLYHSPWLCLDVLTNWNVSLSCLLAKVSQTVWTLVVRVLGTPIH